MSERPITRAGHIAYGRNRFCGADVFDELAAQVVTPGDLLARALGARALDEDDRELLRCAALALTSPDPRVWPLKLTRVLASYGNVFAGFYGAQLASATQKMGPNSGTGAAQALAWLLDQIRDDDDDEAFARKLDSYLAQVGRIGGFGVPFRDEDERQVALTRLLEHHPITRRRPWQMHLRMARVMRAAHGLQVNVVLPLVAIALDLGIAPRRAGLWMSLTMAHTFAAHAVEALDHDAPFLRELPVASIDYRGRAPRQSPAAAAATARGSARAG
ncbi:MAG: hypothetical protein ABJE95_20785 [Byssovorax sp.]